MFLAYHNRAYIHQQSLVPTRKPHGCQRRLVLTRNPHGCQRRLVPSRLVPSLNPHGWQRRLDPLPIQLVAGYVKARIVFSQLYGAMLTTSLAPCT